MSTGIQWTDETWNPVVGCERVSPGCAHCYAKTLHDMRHKATLAGKKLAPQYAVPFETVQLKPDRLDAPLRWRKPKRIFVNSVSDLFHDDVPFHFIDDVFYAMRAAPQHTYQILTKRPQRMLDWAFSTNARFGDILGAHVGQPAQPPRNWHFGVSVENQRFADERIPLLLQMPAAVRFLSCEPLLGPVDLRSHLLVYSHRGEPCCVEKEGYHATRAAALEPRLHWCIIGGESGKGARPFDVRWARNIVAECRAAGVAPFVKQLGALPVTPDLTHWRCSYFPTPDLSGYNLVLRDSHGGDMAEWPADLRVREFPASGVRS